MIFAFNPCVLNKRVPHSKSFAIFGNLQLCDVICDLVNDICPHVTISYLGCLSSKKRDFTISYAVFGSFPPNPAYINSTSMNYKNSTINLIQKRVISGVSRKN